MTTEDHLFDEYDKWEQDTDTLPKLLKIVPNEKSFFQITKETLGPYDKKEWLKKIIKIATTHKKLGIGDNSFNEIEKARIKTFLMYVNDKIEEIIFAYDPIQILTDEQVDAIIKENHNDVSGHLGIQKTYAKIKERFKIPHLFSKVEEFIKNCVASQKQKLVRIRTKEISVIPQTPTEPNEKIAMDIIGPMPKTKRGNQYILSIHDDLTKYLILIPLKTQRTESIIDALLNHYIYIFSAPKTILTDQGQNFISELMTKFEEAFKIKHIKTTSFHPQSNGSLERTHAKVKDMIRTSLNDSDKEWDEILNFVCLGYNTGIHDATGFSPFELTFGRKANLPSSISRTPNYTYEEMFTLWQKQLDKYKTLAKRTLEQSRRRYMRDQRRKIIKIQTVFKEGDTVLVHNDHKTDKLDDEWLGPYYIEKAMTPYYEILINNQIKKIHGNRIKPYFSGRSSHAQPSC